MSGDCIFPISLQIGNGIEFVYKSAFAKDANAVTGTSGSRAVLVKDLRQYATFCPSCVIYAGQMLSAGHMLQNDCGHTLKVFGLAFNIFRSKQKCSTAMPTKCCSSVWIQEMNAFGYYCRSSDSCLAA
jgi:hypothetical protein